MNASHIVILTGAGVSAESGLGTFRDAGGLWTKVDLADVATPEGYMRDPALVLDFSKLPQDEFLPCACMLRNQQLVLNHKV